MRRSQEMGCSCLSWAAEEGGPLWGRNFDLNCLPPDTQVTFLPPGTVYGGALTARWGAVGVGTLAVPGMPMLYEGVNQMGLMGGQLNYRGFAHYPETVRPGTVPLPPGGAVYHLLARCASVAEVVEVLEREVTVAALPLLGAVPTVHWAFTDGTGESVVIEPEAEGLRICRDALGVHPLYRRGLRPVPAVLLDHLSQSAGAVCGPAPAGGAGCPGPVPPGGGAGLSGYHGSASCIPVRPGVEFHDADTNIR